MVVRDRALSLELGRCGNCRHRARVTASRNRRKLWGHSRQPRIWDDDRRVGVRRPWGIWGDIQYINLRADAATAGLAFGDANVDVEILVLSLGAEWVAVETADSDLRLVGGLRRWQVDTGIALNAGLRPARTASGSDNWIDGIVGVRGRYNLSGRLYLPGWVLAGAGGSDFMADVMGGIGYELSEQTSIIAGYRYMSVDRVDGSFVYDVDRQGFVFGLKLTFP